MARIKTYGLAAGTLICALGIGYVMQYGFSAPENASIEPPQEIKVTDVTMTTSAVLPKPAENPAAAPAGNDLPVTLAAASAETSVQPAELPDPALSEPVIDCDMKLTAQTGAGAMVRLLLKAPCQGGERVTIHHNGLMFTEVVQPNGMLTVTVPALAKTALFIASFPNGEGATAMATVTSLSFYDRVALQWKGEAGLQLHAREFGADYFSDGHVWSDAAGDLSRAARGESGFMTRLGRGDAPDALVAEIYSFPAGTAQRGGRIALTVEAEVSATNCGRDVEAQTLELRGNTLRARDLTLAVPNCAATGDFLVLRNIVDDLTIAAR